MEHLLVEQTTGHPFGQFASREAALDEVIELIRQDGPEVTASLGLMWRHGDQVGSVEGDELLRAAETWRRTTG